MDVFHRFNVVQELNVSCVFCLLWARSLWGYVFRTGALFFIVVNQCFSSLSAAELFITERKLFMWVWFTKLHLLDPRKCLTFFLPKWSGEVSLVAFQWGRSLAAFLSRESINIKTDIVVWIITCKQINKSLWLQEIYWWKLPSLSSPCSHEYISGYYRLSVYFLCKILSDIITLRTIPGILFTCVAYFMVGR